ncbi:MAG: Flp pilus assembly complex ATPase component TadA [Candidatus Terrybacteria bacterium]|nr:Flp pilus assembly complex ATPase component TadA [Candidatus Terrybacteria bacterium]
MRFTDILIKKNIVTPETLAKISARSSETGIPLEKLLQTEGVSESVILEAKGEATGVPAKSVSKKEIPFDILKQIPEEAIRHYKFAPLGVRDDVLEVGMVNPDDLEAREALQFIVSKLNLSFRIFLINESDFESILEEYKGLHGEVTKVLGELETALIETAKEPALEDFLKPETKFIEEAPVTKMVAVILKHATAGNASDIHIEPLHDKLKVRFRVDGVLHTSLLLPINVHEAIVSRIKILTNMKLDEKRRPQDGRFGARIEGKDIDFRVSTFPSFWGEKIAIRILDKTKGVKTFEEIGLSEDQIKIIREALKRPYGLILLTGPTGSGKTTTLYAMLQELDKEKNNIISLEDPVEYNIEGINQSQVKPEIGYDFANGLRSILRQDPDMIMVGEIRDKETAALAIQAALTGHLVFSTLHTNNAAGIIPRLVDMGVDPFLIAPTLLLAIAQRLVRTLCPDSRKEIPLTGAVKERIEKEMMDMPPEIKKNFKIPDKIYQGIPSAVCPQGAKGRTGIFEILRKTPELENIILTNPAEPEIMKEARRQNMFTIREEGLVRLFNGAIGFEEFTKL